MWNNSGYSSESVSVSPVPMTNAVIPGQGGGGGTMMNMNKYVDYFYRQPTCTYYTYHDFLVVIDFEATCDDTRNVNPRPIRHERPEIIQFPAILVNVRTMEVDGIFNSIVKPVEAPVLSDFCTDLTGITQSMVKKAPTFPLVLRRFEAWLKSHGIALNNQEYGHSFAIVTDGSYDMGHFLYKQCIISQIPYPQYATRWVNIRTIFTKLYRRRWVCLKAAMEYLGLPFEGRAHNGLDDSKNICKVLMQFLRAGCVIHQTERILLQPGEQERNEARILNDKSAGKYDLATVAPISSKEYEHIFVYSTDVWSTHRCVPPELIHDQYPPSETSSFDSSSSSDSVVMMNTSEYHCGSPNQQQHHNNNHHQNNHNINNNNNNNQNHLHNQHHHHHHNHQASTTGSCESIASGCSNKENSIPIYIPTTNNKSPASLKSRSGTSPGAKDVITVSAAGVGVGSPISSSATSSPVVVSASGRHHGGRRKKRNPHLKDGTSNGSSVVSGGNSPSSGTQGSGGEGGGGGSCIKPSDEDVDDDEVVAKVGSELNVASSRGNEVSHLSRHHHQHHHHNHHHHHHPHHHHHTLQSTKALDSDHGSSTQHLQPLVSDLRTEE